MKKVVFLEFLGPVFNTGSIFEDDLEDGCRTSLDKMDRNFYATISRPFRNNDRIYIPFR